MSTVISVENLGKKYTISHQQRGDSSSLREVITNSVSSFGKKMITPFRRSPAPCPLPHDPAVEDFWALKDVSFEVKQGDRIGIIGRNGAGKSTLLKVLSRITEPTTGRVKIKGRVASLLEVGTGFHPELTGRENIYLNGAILGMGRQEISRKFDEIVAFAEIEKFLDTPVKRYSSGMYVRLAFAVAAHLEPEILIVDEVLAVGDAQFQKKCLGKMEEVGREGRTVLFVSHNMGAVKRLCKEVILLSGGAIKMIGMGHQVISNYLHRSSEAGHFKGFWNFEGEEIQLGREVQLLSVNLLAKSGKTQSSFRMDELIQVAIHYQIVSPIESFHLYAKIYTIDGIHAFSTADWDSSEIGRTYGQPGICRATFVIPENLLNAGEYVLSLDGLIPSVRYIFQESNLLCWEVSSHGGAGGMESTARKGVFRPRLNWDIE